MNYLRYRKIVQYLLLVVIILFIITGYGMTEHKTMESLTFGLLDKAFSFRIHSGLVLPLIVLLILHVFNFRRRKES